MKLHSAIQYGLLGGLVFSLGIHLTVFFAFYTGAYNFHAPAWLATVFNVIGWPLMIASALALGPLAVRAAGDAARGWRSAALTGGGAGLAAGVLVYLLIGALASVMVLGVVPLIMPLSDPASTAGVAVDDLLRPVVQSAVVGVYQIQLGFLLSWAALSALTGTVFALVRPLLRKKKAQAAEPAADLAS